MEITETFSTDQSDYSRDMQGSNQHLKTTGCLICITVELVSI